MGGEQRINVPLPGLVGQSIEVRAGEPAQLSGVFIYPESFGPFDEVTINLEDTLPFVSFTTADSTNKLLPSAQTGETTSILFRVGASEQLDTVCETGLSYGPFRVAGDGTRATAVEPATATLQSASLVHVNGRSFSYCVEITSPVDASVDVDGLAVDTTAQQQTPSGDCAPLANFAGNWHSTYTCSDSCIGASVGGNFCVTISQQGQQASYNDGFATFSGTVCGDVWSLSAETDGETESGTLTLNADGTATKITHYSGECSGDCQDTFTRTDRAPSSESCPNGGCSNSMDDDSDGLVDCGDPDCTADPACGGTTTSTGCNPACGFDSTSPDSARAGAICNIFFPSDTGGPIGGGGGECSSDSQCDDGDPCTADECVGAVVFVCQNTPIVGCSGPPQVRNGDQIFFEFDHTIVSLSVNGQSADAEQTSWTASGLSQGTQTLNIEWQNRPGGLFGDTGCHNIEVAVIP